jgi:hypothetical protein
MEDPRAITRRAKTAKALVRGIMNIAHEHTDVPVVFISGLLVSTAKDKVIRMEGTLRNSVAKGSGLAAPNRPSGKWRCAGRAVSCQFEEPATTVQDIEGKALLAQGHAANAAATRSRHEFRNAPLIFCCQGSFHSPRFREMTLGSYTLVNHIVPDFDRPVFLLYIT